MSEGIRTNVRTYRDEDLDAVVMDTFEIEEDGVQKLVVRPYIPAVAREWVLESEDWSTAVINEIVARIDAGEGADIKVTLT